MSDLDFTAEDMETGGTKRPTRTVLRAVHPELGQVGELSYYQPRRKADGLLVDRLEVPKAHQGHGYGSALMDEMQRRHPGMKIDHGDRTDAGRDWWAAYTRGKRVQRGRTMAHAAGYAEYLRAGWNRKADEAEDPERRDYFRQRAQQEYDYEKARGRGHQIGEPWKDRSDVGWVRTDRMGNFREHSGDQHSASGDTVDAIADDLRQGIGFHSPIHLYYDPSNHRASIGEGNHRLKAAEQVGLSHVPVVMHPASRYFGGMPRGGFMPKPDDKPEPPTTDSYHPRHVVPDYWLHGYDPVSGTVRHRTALAQKNFDELAPHEQAAAAMYHQQMIEDGDAESHTTPRDYHYEMRQEPIGPFLKRYMDADDEFKAEYGPDEFQAHHEETLRNHPIPHYPAENRWPLIVRDSNPNYVDDGYHRMHSYIRDGATHIPTMRMHPKPGVRRQAVTDKWPPYLTERPDEYGDMVPVNVSRHNPRGPVGTEEDARRLGWAGPYYHGTTKRRAREIRQRGFRQPRIPNWEMAQYGTQEEIDAGNTHRTFFTPHREEAEHFARSQHGDDADVVTAYLHPDHLTTDEGGGFMESTQVKDVAHAMAIRPARKQGAGSLPTGLMFQHKTNLRYPDEHVLIARHPDLDFNAGYEHHAGHITWFGDTGEVSGIEVNPNLRRRGLATELWNRAKQITPHLRHSDNLTDDGKKWAPTVGAFTPTKRLFGPTEGLDHRLFNGTRLKPDVRKYILETLAAFWKPLFGYSWNEWARVYFAGSEASEWTSPEREGNNDFDVLIGVNYDAFRGSQSRTSKYQTMTNDEITADLNVSLRKLNEQTAAAYIPVEGYEFGPFSNTWYVNPNSWDIRAIKPYAAYDVTHNRWAVKPPHLPDWSLKDFPEGHALVLEARAVSAYVRAVLSLPEPYRSQQGFALWNHLHSDRGRAFGPQGEGWYDPGNVLEKWLDQEGLWDQLVKIMVDVRAHPEKLNAPADWSNMPKVAMPWYFQRGEGPADHPEIKSVRHAGFAGYVGESPERKEDYGYEAPEHGFDEDAWEDAAPEPTTHEQRHYDEHDEYPESYYERHERAYQEHVNRKAAEDEPDHEDDDLHEFIGEKGADYPFWQNHATLGMVGIKDKPVYATQTHVSQRHIDKYLKNPHADPHFPGYGEYAGNEAPMLVTHEGRLHAIEGHHRVAAALQRGDEKIHAWHYDADKHGFPEYS